jgi:hypothetical protein
MKADNPRTSPNRFVLLTYTVIVIVVFALLALVVIMLFTGTLQIIGRDVIGEKYLQTASIVSAACIAGLSLFVFVRNFKKIYNHLEQMLSRKCSIK